MPAGNPGARRTAGWAVVGSAVTGVIGVTNTLDSAPPSPGGTAWFRTNADDSFIHIEGQVYIDSNGTVWLCTVDGSPVNPGTWTRMAVTLRREEPDTGC